MSPTSTKKTEEKHEHAACVWGKEQSHCVIWGKWQSPRRSSHTRTWPTWWDHTVCFQPLDCDWAVLNPHRHVQGRIRYLLFSCHVSSSSYHINTCSKHPTTTFQNHINCLNFTSSEQWNTFLTGSVFCNQSLLVCAFNLISWCFFFLLEPTKTAKQNNGKSLDHAYPTSFTGWVRLWFLLLLFSSSFLGYFSFQHVLILCLISLSNSQCSWNFFAGQWWRCFTPCKQLCLCLCLSLCQVFIFLFLHFFSLY